MFCETRGTVRPLCLLNFNKKCLLVAKYIKHSLVLSFSTHFTTLGGINENEVGLLTETAAAMAEKVLAVLESTAVTEAVIMEIGSGNSN